MKLDIKTILLIIVTIVASYFIYTSSKNKESLEFYKYNTSVMTDSITFLKDKDGNNQAKIRTFQSQETKMFLELETKDSEILALQEEVKKAEDKLKKRGSVTNFGSTTSIDTVFITQVQYDLDSFPIYKSQINLDEWITGLVEARIDGMEVNLQVKNTYSVTVGEESGGLFKKGTPYVMVTNHNPYTMTTSLRTYQVEVPKPKRFFVGPIVGIDITLRPVIGIGIGYGIIKF